MDVHEPLGVTPGEAACTDAETGAPDVLTTPTHGAGWAHLWFASRFGT